MARTKRVERRISERLVCAQPAQLIRPGQSIALPVAILDLSTGGAGLELCESALLSPSPIALRLIDGTELAGRIQWQCSMRAGLTFELRLLDPRDLLALECMGQDYYLAAVRHQLWHAGVVGRQSNKR